MRSEILGYLIVAETETKLLHHAAFFSEFSWDPMVGTDKLLVRKHNVIRLIQCYETL